MWFDRLTTNGLPIPSSPLDARVRCALWQTWGIRSIVDVAGLGGRIMEEQRPEEQRPEEQRPGIGFTKRHRWSGLWNGVVIGMGLSWIIAGQTLGVFPLILGIIMEVMQRRSLSGTG